MTRRVLITGAAQGIGAAIARAFAARGDTLALLDKQASVAEIADELDAMAVVADLADSSDRVRACDEVLEAWGGVDVLVNNAGFGVEGSVLDVELEGWRKVLEVDLTAPMHLSQRLAPHMPEGASIVNVSSVQGIQAEQDNAAYTAAKAGLNSLTRSMALDLAPKGIRVNAVAPGAIDTPLLREGLQAQDDPEQAREDWADLHALRRIGRPEEVAEVVEFLASNRASFVTGVTLPVDGGMLASFMMAGRPV